MKNILLLAVITFLGITTAQAQQSKVSEEKMESINLLAEQLNMTEKQKASVAKTIIAFDASKENVWQSTASEADKKAKVEKIEIQKNKNIQSYLTEEQYAQYVKLKKK